MNTQLQQQLGAALNVDTAKYKDVKLVKPKIEAKVQVQKRRKTKLQFADLVDENPRLKGKVVFFNDEKGFGFVSNGSNPDVFIHDSNFNKCIDRKLLTAGDELSFLTDTNPKNGKLIAIDISLV